VASACTAGGAGCAGGACVSGDHNEVRINFGAHFPMICFATVPEDCQAMAAPPMHAVNSTAVRPRIADLLIERRWPGIWTVSVTAGRNVVSTGGTGGSTEKSDPIWVCGFDERRAASCNRLEISSSAGATRTASGATTMKSCGSSLSFGFGVDCIGTPCSVQCHPPDGGRRTPSRRRPAPHFIQV